MIFFPLLYMLNLGSLLCRYCMIFWNLCLYNFDCSCRSYSKLVDDSCKQLVGTYSLEVFFGLEWHGTTFESDLSNLFLVEWSLTTFLVYQSLEKAISNWLIHSIYVACLSLSSYFRSNVFIYRVTKNFIIVRTWWHTLSEIRYLLCLLFRLLFSFLSVFL